MAAIPSPQRIAVFRLHGLGDALLTTPAIRALRTTWPHARITAIIGGTAAPALRDNPCLDHLLEIDERPFLRRRPLALLRLGLRLRRERFDLLVLFSRSRALRTWARLTGATTVAGLTHHRDAPDGTWRDTTYEGDQYLELAASLGAASAGNDLQLTIPTAATAAARALLDSQEARSGWLALAPGGGDNAAWDMPQKRWPADRFAAFADRAADRWGLRSLVIGGTQDKALAHDIAARVATPILDATGTPLSTSAALIARSRLLVCNDSVAVHIGLITGTPTVALFGPTNPCAVLPPAPRRVRVVHSALPCAPCFWQARPDLRTATGHGAFACTVAGPGCLEQLELAPVLAAARDLLGADGIALGPGA